MNWFGLLSFIPSSIGLGLILIDKYYKSLFSKYKAKQGDTSALVIFWVLSLFAILLYRPSTIYSNAQLKNIMIDMLITSLSLLLIGICVIIPNFIYYYKTEDVFKNVSATMVSAMALGFGLAGISECVIFMLG